MIGVPGTADRMFSALKSAGVSVTLISQASSEHSICIAVPQDLAERATRVIRTRLRWSWRADKFKVSIVTDEQSIVAVVGDGMAGTPGIAARFFGTLARAGINVRAIAQGSSERNISAVVDSEDATRALRAAHSGFYLSSKTYRSALSGPGRSGRRCSTDRAAVTRCSGLQSRSAGSRYRTIATMLLAIGVSILQLAGGLTTIGRRSDS